MYILSVLKAIPQGEWFCPDCKPKEVRTPRKERKSTIEEDDDDEDEAETVDSVKEESDEETEDDEDLNVYSSDQSEEEQYAAFILNTIRIIKKLVLQLCKLFISVIVIVNCL